MPKQRRKFALLSVTLLLHVLGFASLGSPQAEDRRQVKWRTAKITLAVSSSLFGGRLSADEDVSLAIREGFSAWESASVLSFNIRDTNAQSVSPKGVKGDGVSLLTIASTPENLKLFPRQADSPAATTRIFFNSRGEITEADIVLNPFIQFSTDGAIGTFDLRGVVMHEAGHLLGLDHSPVWGSKMYERLGKNSEASITARSAGLTMSDISAVRGLYGGKLDDVTCCTAIEIRPTTPDSGKIKYLTAWLEEAGTGRVAAAASSTKDGPLRIGGIAEGNYRAFVQTRMADGRVHSATTEANADLAEEVKVSVDVGAISSPTPISFFGLNAKLEELPVRFNPGQTYRVWAGGVGLDLAGLSPSFYTEHFSASVGSMRATEFSSSVKALSFDIRIAPDTPVGLYTLPFETATGGRIYLPGAISVVQN